MNIDTKDISREQKEIIQELINNTSELEYLWNIRDENALPVRKVHIKTEDGKVFIYRSKVDAQFYMTDETERGGILLTSFHKEDCGFYINNKYHIDSTDKENIDIADVMINHDISFDNVELVELAKGWENNGRGYMNIMLLENNRLFGYKIAEWVIVAKCMSSTFIMSTYKDTFDHCDYSKIPDGDY